MILVKSSRLSDYVESLLASGRVVFAGEEASQALGVAKGPFLDAAERLQRHGRLFRPRCGFYVVVPPQHRSWGAPPPSWYIDDLMRFIARPYYVGLLKAAELHGATHQAVTEFQVVTDRQLAPIEAGRSVLKFFFRKAIGDVADGIDEHKTDTGRMKVSSPELTALDLLRYPTAGVGLDNIATVLTDLGERLDVSRLSRLAKAFERTTTQRLGYLLDHLGYGAHAEPLAASLPRERLAWIELDPAEAADADFAPEPIERCQRWRVIVRRAPEVDQ
jgi:predicted transcriptional regulator of viral defense system